MLTEPSTTPPARTRRIVYGAVVGALFAPFLHFGRLFLTPELALIAGNLFSYLASPKARYRLKLEAKVQLAPDIYELRFTSDRRIRFRPGQYLEWTLGHSRPDNRGNRRYFTIASSPGAAIAFALIFFGAGPIALDAVFSGRSTVDRGR